jgi:hypothetical protein
VGYEDRNFYTVLLRGNPCNCGALSNYNFETFFSYTKTDGPVVKTLFIGIILGAASCLFIFFIRDTETNTISEHWVHDTTYVKPDTVIREGKIRYVPITQMVKEYHTLHDTLIRSDYPQTSTESFPVAEMDTVFGRGRDSNAVYIGYALPPINRFRVISRWNQDSYKVITIKKQNKFGLGAFVGPVITKTGLTYGAGVGLYYKFEFDLGSLF